MDFYIKEEYFGLPVFCMMVGLPASGKSSIAAETKFYRRDEYIIPIVHSSDSLREELYGDVNDQSHNEKLFLELHKRIKNDLKNGKDVIYDATNISKKRRIAFLKELKKIKSCKCCILTVADYNECIVRNSKRERIVPESVIKKMYMSWCPPSKDEGFDMIAVHYTQNVDAESKYQEFINKAKSFDQENSHHTLTLLEHCKKTAEYVSEAAPDNRLLQAAALIHDCGKIFTKTRLNARGIDDGECHYYQHQCVGAYDSLMIAPKYTIYVDEALYISNLIYYHMHPHMAWKSSNRVRERDRKLLGDKMMTDIMLLNEADSKAH